MTPKPGAMCPTFARHALRNARYALHNVHRALHNASPLIFRHRRHGF